MSGTNPDYSGLYAAAGAKHDLDPDLLRAMGDQESSQNRFAVSPAGAQGLMQIMPGTQKELGVTEPFVPEQSINGGAQYMRKLLAHPRTGGDVYQAIAAYNAGPGGDFTNPETTNYVKRVADRWDAYRQARWNKPQTQADDWTAPAQADDWTTPAAGALVPAQQDNPPTAGQSGEGAPVHVPGQGMVGALANAVRKGVVQGTAGAVEGAGDIYRNVTGADPTADNVATSWGKRYTKRAEESYPIDSQNEGMTTRIAGGLGSMVPMVGAGMVADAAAIPIAGVAAAAGIVGAQSYASTHDDALAKGATPKEADHAASISAPVQAAIMGLPVGRVLHAMPELATGLWTTLEGMAKRGVEFGSFNAVSRAADNYVAQKLYDPKRGVMDGVGEAAAEGALTGPVFHLPQAARTAAEALTRPAAAPGLAANVAAQQAAAAGAQATPAPQAPRPATPAETLATIAAGGDPKAAAPTPAPVAAAPAAPAAPPAPPTPAEVLGNIAQGRDPKTPVEQQGPPPPPQGPPIAPMGPPEAPHGPPIAPMGPLEAPHGPPAPPQGPPEAPLRAAVEAKVEPWQNDQRVAGHIQDIVDAYRRNPSSAGEKISSLVDGEWKGAPPEAFGPLLDRIQTALARVKPPKVEPPPPPAAPSGPRVFINHVGADGLTDAERGRPLASAESTPAMPKQTVGDKPPIMVNPGEKLFSQSGRELSPVPDYPALDSDRKTKSAQNKVNNWLLREARNEAAATGNDKLASDLRSLDVRNFSNSDHAMVNDALFGGDGPTVDHRGPKPAAAPVESTPAIKPRDMLPNVLGNQKWEPVGKNVDGLTVYADKNGVHSTVENGIRSSEPVGVRPGGGLSVKAPADKDPQYRVVATPEATPAPQESKTAPAEAEQWWKHNLTEQGRSLVQDAAGLKNLKKTAWHYLKPEEQAALWEHRAAGEAPQESKPTPEARTSTDEPKPKATPPLPDATPERAADYGTNNKVFTADLAKAARERLRAKLNGSTLNSGFDPQLMLDGLTLAGYHVEAGARSFVDYSKAMLSDLGEAVRPYLGQFYTAVRMHPGFDHAGMDGHAEVEAALARPQEHDNGVQEGVSGGVSESRPEGVQPTDTIGEDERAPADRRDGSEGLPGSDPSVSAEGRTGQADHAGDPGSGGTGDGDVHRVPEPNPRDDGRPPAEPAEPPAIKDRPDAGVTGTNFSIEPGGVEEARGRIQKARDNLEAIRLTKRLLAEDRPATKSEQAVLSKYVGWGGLSGAFPGSDGKLGKGLEKIGASLRELLTEEEHKTASASTQYAHYTAEHVIRSMWDAVKQMGFKGGDVFEPGMGVGHFLGMAPPDVAANMRYQGVEMDHLTASIAKLLYPESGVRQGDFTKTPLPEKTFDLVIGNPPFSDAVIHADPKYRANKFMLHDYFFAKSLDAVRPGGLLGFVTSAGTMNKLDASARHYLAERAEFVGGVRLPSDAFRKNAGTDVTTDILFFKRRLDEKVKLDQTPTWAETVERDLPNAEGARQAGNVNRYFSENPQQVLGNEGYFDKLYKGRYAVHNFEGGDLESNLRAAIDRLPRDVMEAPPTAEQRAALDFASGQTKDGSYYMSPDGKLMQYAGGAGREVGRRGTGEGGLTQAEQERVRHLIPMRDALRDVFRHDLMENTAEAAAARTALNQHYDTFVAKFGPINKAEFTYRRPTRVQEEAARAEAREEARAAGMPWNEGSWTPDASLSKATVTGLAKERQKARDQHAAMDRPFDEGDFDPSAMGDIVTEKRPNIKPFGADPESYRLRSIEQYDDVTGASSKKDIFHQSILTREREPQLNSANDGVLWSMNSLGKFDVDAIAAKMGRDKASLLAELGDKVFKVPGTEDTHQTADEYLSGDVVTKLEQARAAAATDPEIRRNVEALEAAVPPPLAPSEIVMTLGMPWIPRETVQDFVRDHLELGSLNVSHAPGIGSWIVEGGKYAPQGAGFAKWSSGTDRTAHELLKDALNKTPPRIYDTVRNPDGSKSSVFNAVATQKAQDKVDAIKAAFQEYVNADTSRADALAELYNNKLNRNVLRQYDGAYLTTPGISAAWNWRPHQTRVVARIIQDGNTYMAHAVGAGKTSAMIGAGMEMRRLGLVKKPMYVVPNHMLGQFAKEFYEQYPTARIAVADEERFHTDRRKQFVANIAQDDLDAVIITHSGFGKLPISGGFADHLVQEQVDMLRESLDKLEKDSDRITVKKIENAIEKLQQKLSGQGVGKADQTLTFEETGVDHLFVDEAHEFRKLALATKQGQMKGIASEGSDKAWDLYTKTRYLDQQKPGRSLVMASGTPITNTMGELYSLSRFIQPDALASRGLTHFDSWAQTFGDTKTALEETASGSYKPVTRFGSFVNLPELYKMVGAQMDIVTPKQLEQYVVRPQLKGGQREFHLAPRSELLDAYQAELGARMEAIAARKGPPKKGDDIMLSVINDGRHSAIDPRFVAHTHSDPNSKLNIMLSNVAQIYHDSAHQEFFDPKDGYKTSLGRGPAAQMIFANLGVNERGPAGFSGYRWMKQELMRQGVSAEHIAYIGDYPSTMQRQKLFGDVNAGIVRVLIGSSQKMGTGVNAQKRLIALHNQDPLWYPADDEQRVGRLIRQGNTNPEVQVHDYSTKGTYDSAMWKMMGNKARFIEQFFRGDPSLRSMEDIGEASMYEQASAMSTTDERIIELTQMRQDLEQAKRREQGYDRDQYQTRNTIKQNESAAAFYREQAGHAVTDIAQRQDTTGDKFTMKVGNQDFPKRADAAAALETLAQNTLAQLQKGQMTQVGMIGGFPLMLLRTHSDAMQFRLKTNNADGLPIEGKSYAGAISSAEAKIRGLEDQHAYYKQNEAKALARNAALQKEVGKPFTGRADVVRLTKQVADFEAMLKAEADAKQQAPQADAPPADPRFADPEDDESKYAKRAPQDAAQEPAQDGAREALREPMRQMLRFMGIPDTVGLNFVDKLAEHGANGADAKYDKGLITYALDTAAGVAPAKLFHEATHALMDEKLGLLNAGQRKALLVGADRWLNDGARGVARRAELKGLGYSGAEVREEAVARMAEEALGRGLQPKSLLGGAISKMRNFAQGLGQVLRGQGFTTAEDVFNGLLGGKRALPGAIDAMHPPATKSPAGEPPIDTVQGVRDQDNKAPAGEQASARSPLDEAFPPEGTKSLGEILAAQRDEKYSLRSITEYGHRAADDIAKAFSPTSRGVDAKATELTIRGRAAKQAQSSAQSGAALEAYRHAVGRLSEAQQNDITDKMERGLPQADPAMQPVADAIRAELDKWTARIQSLGTGKLAQANVNYMGRAYSNYEEWSRGQQAAPGHQAAGLANEIGAGIGKRPLKGSGNFLKERTFEYLSDARAAGLTPVSSNPLEMQTLKLREMQKFFHGSKLAEEMKEQGLARWVRTEGYGAAARNGLVGLDDRMFTPKVMNQSPEHGLVEHGKWMAAEPAARIFNNFVSQGLAGHSTIYDTIRAAGNTLNSLQLSLSAFHATFIGLDTMTSRVGLGLQQIMRGDFGRGIVNTALGFSPHNIATSIANGSKLRSAYLDPQNATPEWRKLAEMLNAGGGRINMDQFYRSNASGAFFKNLNDLKNPGSAMREAWAMAKDTPLSAPFKIAGRVMDTMMEPIMGQMVPRAKLGVFADLAADWARRNPNATPEQTAKEMTKYWDSVDNRMGQLVYDNLFWNKVSKDMAFISTRSVGWNLGTIRELGGGIVDTGRAVNDMAHLRTPEFTTRMAYALAMPTLTAVMGAMLTFAYTGGPPTSLMDYFYPPNGKDDGGRVSIPGYIKDVVSYWRAPVDTLLNKLHPLGAMASQIHRNRDYRGGIIYDKLTDNMSTAYLEYLLNTTMPFTVSAMRKNAEGTVSMFDQALAVFGVQPAPQSVLHPEKQEQFQLKDDHKALRARQKENLWHPFGN